ncbi:hypothetical protein GCM10029963_42450 [Micromonospora andamanensis]
MAVTDWEPATGAEAAMRDALHGNDQQLYFRILSGVELLLPVSAQAAAGRTPVGWGTWTTGGRTHVLAFTSAEAMRACLGEHAGPSRRTGYAELAASWPNHEWWLAVNPGLPIEGYLPAWYVSQLSRGDVRLPGRTVGARARLERVEALNRARDAATTQPAPATPNPLAPPRPPGPVRPTQLSPAPPVVPAAFQLPEVPLAASGTVTGPRPGPADRPPPRRARRSPTAAARAVPALPAAVVLVEPDRTVQPPWTGCRHDGRPFPGGTRSRRPPGRAGPRHRSGPDPAPTDVRPTPVPSSRASDPSSNPRTVVRRIAVTASPIGPRRRPGSGAVSRSPPGAGRRTAVRRADPCLRLRRQRPGHHSSAARADRGGDPTAATARRAGPAAAGEYPRWLGGTGWW